MSRKNIVTILLKMKYCKVYLIFEFQLCTVVVNDSVTRQAITKEQEELFLEFIRNDDHYSKYYNGMFILFKTGLRISEFCGLTVKDIDLQERKSM